MTITELFVTSNRELLRVIDQIQPAQWTLAMPAISVRNPADLETAVRYGTYDDAWVPDTLTGKSIDEVGTKYDALRTPDSGDALSNYRTYNERAVNAIKAVTDLDPIVHLTYGDYPIRDFLQHTTSFRAFRSYDIAKLIGIDTTMNPDFVAALLNEFTPVIDWYRQVGVFPPALDVDVDTDPQTRLLAMVGRE